MRASRAPLFFSALLVAGCSCSGEIVPGHDAGAPDAFVEAPDAGHDAFVAVDADTDAGPPAMRDGSMYEFDAGEGGIVHALCRSPIPSGCLVALTEGTHGLCNQLDDDCDGQVDEGCTCTSGTVQSCFRGPPGRAHVGACADGMQVCNGAEFGAWGPCEGGIAPAPETCDGLDDDCNGCTDEITGCIPLVNCPGPDDPRVPGGEPFVDYPIDGTVFYPGPADAWAWQIRGGPCDAILPHPSFTITDETTATPTFHPTLSGDYVVRMTVTLPGGATLSCTWLIHVQGPGLRVEMCYPESEIDDLDLFLSMPGYTGDWYVDTVDAFGPSPSICGWHDCEAEIRGTLRGTTTPYARADWGYANSPLSACDGGPHGPEWTALGYCANPRLDIDNNLAEGSGLPENINVDAPNEGDRFRVMVQNFTGALARPTINVYCGGHLVASTGPPPSFSGFRGTVSIGAMWRVLDVTTHLDASGETTCDITTLHPPGTTSGFYVTHNLPEF